MKESSVDYLKKRYKKNGELTESDFEKAYNLQEYQTYLFMNFNLLATHEGLEPLKFYDFIKLYQK